MLELVENGFAISADAYDDARRTASQARRSLADLMADVDVILSPSAPGAAPKGLTSTGSSTFNRLWTLMGTPCVNVPGLADLAGLPLGMQVIGTVRQRPGDARGRPVRRVPAAPAKLTQTPRFTPPGCTCLKNALGRADGPAPRFGPIVGILYELIQILMPT